MIYKKGDKVKIIDRKYFLYNYNLNTLLTTGEKIWHLKHGYAMNEEMSTYCGKTLTVSSVKIFNKTTGDLYYTFKECKKPYCWSPQLIECKI